MTNRHQLQESQVLIGLQDEEILNTSVEQNQWQCNKIGGLPDWMPCNADAQNPACDICQKRSALAMQIYCPLGASTYHRTLYIFCCINPDCWNKAGSWKILRCQHRDDSEDFLDASKSMDEQWAENENNWGMDSEDLLSDKVSTSPASNGIASFENLNISNVPADKEVICSAEIERCDENNPVCVDASNIDENAGAFLQWEQERRHSMRADVQSSIPIFKPFYVSVIEEPKDADDPDEHVIALLNDYQRKEGNPFNTMNKQSRGIVNEAYEKDRAQHGDQVFHKLLKRVSKCPTQVVRYQWNGQPLYITAPNSSHVVPSACERCGGRRVFELQLMPALLQCLVLENFDAKGPPVEFGTVIVSTCGGSCWNGGDAFLEEYAYVQPDPDEGLFDRMTSRR